MLRFVLGFAVVLAGCQNDPYGTDAGAAPATADYIETVRGPAPRQDSAEVATFGGYEEFTVEELEKGRLDATWRTPAETAPAPRSSTDSTDNPSVEESTIRFATKSVPEAWDEISPDSVNDGAMRLPLGGDVEGPSVVRLQILLDRVRFSPGVIDGRWGKNTEKAVYWFQKNNGLSPTGQVDSTTYRRLLARAGNPERFVATYTLTEDDVAGPFVEIPADIYEKAKLDRLGYESLLEQLGEQFHATPELLRRLNVGLSFDSLAAGAVIQVPEVPEESLPDGASIDRLIVSDAGHYLHAVDSTGRILLHFPSTLGSSYDPSPQGEWKITSITEDPWWHYQPDILAHVPDDQPDARIPPGPNNAVGKVWIALSKPHYGIHGTSAPETIGYATSAGCIRLTNWDALRLSRLVEAGTPVIFRDTDGATA